MTTPATAALLATLRASGALDYDVTSGRAATTKVARFRMPNGRSIVIQTNNKTPRLWVVDDDRGSYVFPLGTLERYVVGQPKHHHLEQIREFRGQPLLKITVTAAARSVESAIAAFGSAP